MNGNFLEAKDLSYSLGGRLIIDNLCLTMANGETVGLIGPVGAGKSTLAQIICNLIEPDSGLINYKGQPIVSIPAGEFFKKISIVFQFPEKQIFQETVYEEIAFGLNNLGYDEEEINARIKKYIGKLGLSSSILGRPPLFLSGGEMRKVALASAFALESELLILDEPFSWLDDGGSEMLADLIAERGSLGSSFIIISHERSGLQQMCSYLWHMKDGAINKVERCAA